MREGECATVRSVNVAKNEACHFVGKPAELNALEIGECYDRGVREGGACVYVELIKG